MTTTAEARNPVGELIAFIRQQAYAAGDRLPPIRQLSETLGFGRNAIRDALLEAQTMGYVRIEPRSGVFVLDAGPGRGSDALGQTLERLLDHDEQNLFHLLDARLLVESDLAAAAARNRRPEQLLPLRQALDAVLTCRGDRVAFIQVDEAFHLQIAQLAGNEVLQSFLRVLLRAIGKAKSNFLLSADNRKLTDREHQELFRSIVEGDAERARAAMNAHIGQGRELLLEYVRTAPDRHSDGQYDQ